MSETGQIIGKQLAAARILVRWSQSELSKRSNISTATLRRIEKYPGPIENLNNNAFIVAHVLNQAGIEFINTDYIGVMFKPAK